MTPHSGGRPTSILINSPTRESRTSSVSGSIRRPPSRVIRTFEEVHVTKTINAEEWYEELECGVCANVLGAPQALVPCGHSLCGSCAWEWIKKNNNLTCPHCRHQLHEPMPFVPNIVVDQIIERKLRSLPESSEKANIMLERQDKAEAWKIIQAAMKPSLPRRRNLDDAVFGFFGMENNLNRQAQHSRRASRHLPELGAPIPEEVRPVVQRRLTHPYGQGMSLAEIRRAEQEDQALPTRAEMRRLREIAIRDQHSHQAALALQAVEEEMSIPRVRLGRPVPTTSPPPVSNPIPEVPRNSGTAPNGPRPLHSRAAAGTRFRVLADRQARGRGSRDQPLVVLTDSE